MARAQSNGNGFEDSSATPLRQDNKATYRYFGNPVYPYSLRQGLADGFLAPYRVHRIVTSADATGWRPTKGELDKLGREIPDEEYHTADFEKRLSLRPRSEAIAKNLTNFLQRTNPYDKTIVFCVDQEHADEMRQLLNNLNTEIVKKHPDYVCRVTSDEKAIGKGHLGRFQELETETPVILTTSQLLSTGVDAPMVKNVVLIRVIGTMTEFKQIIGRGTRLREDYGKFYFNILDYTGTATRHFADKEFDGDPEFVSEEEIDGEGNTTTTTGASARPPRAHQRDQRPKKSVCPLPPHAPQQGLLHGIAGGTGVCVHRLTQHDLLRAYWTEWRSGGHARRPGGFSRVRESASAYRRRPGPVRCLFSWYEGGIRLVDARVHRRNEGRNEDSA